MWYGVAVCGCLFANLVMRSWLDCMVIYLWGLFGVLLFGLVGW